MAQYRLKWTDSGDVEKSIYKNQLNTSAAGNISVLRISVVDQDGTAVNLTGLTTSMKLYVGVEGTLQMNGVTLALVGAATLGTLIYRLTGSDIATAGTYAVNIYCADNATPASATDALTVGGLTLRMVETMSD